MNRIDKKPVVLRSSPNVIKRPVVVYDCDCACASVPQFHGNDANALSNHNLKQSQDILSISLLPKWQGIYLPQAETSFVVLNDLAYELWESFQESRSFSKLDKEEIDVALEMVNSGLLVSPETQMRPLASRQAYQFSAWIHATDRCNLRCAYCYLPHKKEDMTLEIGRAAIDATFLAARVNHYQSVKFKYAGGEPLLKFPFVVELRNWRINLISVSTALFSAMAHY